MVQEKKHTLEYEPDYNSRAIRKKYNKTEQKSKEKKPLKTLQQIKRYIRKTVSSQVK